MADESASNKGKLGFVTILLITINSIMGTGIFFLPAVGAKVSGIFSIAAWVVMGLIGIYLSMIFAELIGLFPREGGVYEYAKESFGSFPSFILGWMTLIAAYITIAMLIVGAIKYVGPILPSSVLIGASILFIVLFNFMAFRGLKTGAIMLITFAGITLTSVLGIIIPGLLSFNPSNFTDWMSHPAVVSLDFASTGGMLGGLSLLAVTIFFIAETFFGWETATFLAGQVKNPKKVMPKVMIIATVSIAIISLLFVVSSISILGWSDLGASITPLADLAGAIYGAAAVPFYSILVFLAIIGSVAGWVVAAPNLIVALAKDKLFITQLAKMHSKTKTPYKAIIFQTIITSILIFVGAGDYESLLHLLVPLVLFLYVMVVVSMLVIRRKYKHAERPYRAPGGFVGPIILILITLSLIVMWSTQVMGALHLLKVIGTFILVAVPLYLMLIFFYDSHATIRFQNQVAPLLWFFESAFLPRSVRKKLLANASVENKIVLELGASSGLLSKEIAKRNPQRQIIIEQSLSLKNMIAKRLRKHTHEIIVMHDEYLTSRIHPDVLLVDEVFSFGLISSLHDAKTYLKHLAQLMPEHSRIHFFDYVDLYKIIPNKEIVDDPVKLKELFRQAGFAVAVRKHKGFLWNYLIIDGVRTKNKDYVYI